MFSNICLAVLLTCLSSTVLAADPKYFLSITGQKAGVVYHNNITTFKNVVPLLSFNFSVTSPRDQASGLPTGKVLYTPVTVWKEMDTSSPILMGILTQNQVFQAVVTAVEGAGAGHAATTLVWKLKNGALTGVTHEARDTQLVEKISMVFQQMEVDATAAGGPTVSTSFDWGNTGA